MTLKVIIIRAEGALAETEDLWRMAFACVFGEAGFEWTWDRDGFARTAALTGSEERVAHYVRCSLKGRPETEDFSLLIGAMHRRAAKLFSDLVERGRPTARFAVRDLVVAARAEGIRLMVAATMPAPEARALLTTVLGSRASEAIDVVAVPGQAGERRADDALYARVADSMGIPARHALVIEASSAGAEAARQRGFPVITTVSACAEPSGKFPEGAIVLASLADLISSGGRALFDPLAADQREELLAVLQRLHVANCDHSVHLDRRNVMRVSDILRTKGSVVKTIDPGATIRALAHGLRSEGVGAMPVVDRNGMLLGIISERDLARGVAEFGSELAAMRVSDLMTKSVVTCRPDDTVAVVAGVMTQRRVRHLPVIVQDTLVGVVSIGDVLKHRLDEVQLEASVLRDFALSRM